MNSRVIFTIAALTLAALAAPVVDAFSAPMPELKSGPVVSCATTPTIINPGGTSSTRSICIQNINAVAIYVGGRDVTTTTGQVVPAGSLADPKTFCVDAHHAWCVVAAATADARITYGTSQ